LRSASGKKKISAGAEKIIKVMIVFSIFLALIPGFAWLVFYLKEDTHPEPKRLVALAFLAGIIAGIFAIIIERFFNQAVAGTGIEEFSIISLLGLALIEELLKFSAAYFSVNKDPRVTEPVDAMIYAIVAALGFATLENIGTLVFVPHQMAFAAALVETSSLRFMGATLLHALASGIVGYYWALGIVRGKIVRHLASGLAIAAILHAAFNYLILNYENISYSVIFLAIVGLFVLIDFEKIKAKPINIIN
jgi:RsiW-degrading membrane proteinase PrsW (M82 family)